MFEILSEKFITHWLAQDKGSIGSKNNNRTFFVKFNVAHEIRKIIRIYCSNNDAQKTPILAF